MSRKIFFHPERCMLCLSCVLACQMDEAGVSSPGAITGAMRPPSRMAVSFSNGTPWVWRCRHCVSAPCVEACVTGSLGQTEGKGTVVHRPDTCVGCGSCRLVCPFGGLRSQEKEARMVKCNLCPEQEVPPCVRACRSKALVFEEMAFFVQKKRKRLAREMETPMKGSG